MRTPHLFLARVRKPSPSWEDEPSAFAAAPLAPGLAALSCALPRLVAGIMQPVKNGRTDMPAPGMGLLEGPGGEALQVDQLQALQEAGYLAQMQDQQAASSGLGGMNAAPGLAATAGLSCGPGDLGGGSASESMPGPSN